ncbi:hypothetical protein [Corynebacterium renale]|uniref:hypothetical protein n=1 Tax=Corynebacterium renale TaxID=1724 RepID=UPI0011774C38|nr:hypothetical protein [Corynebacterium renale]
MDDKAQVNAGSRAQDRPGDVHRGGRAWGGAVQGAGSYAERAAQVGTRGGQRARDVGVCGVLGEPVVDKHSFPLELSPPRVAGNNKQR